MTKRLLLLFSIFAMLGACGTPSGTLVSPEAEHLGGNLYLESSEDDAYYLVLDGEITPETSYVFQSLVEQSEDAGGLNIAQSPGGDLLASIQIGRTIRRHKLSTFVLAECSSACVNVFVAGKERQMMEIATLGLHASNVGNESLDLERRYWSTFGLSHIIERAYETPHESLWVIPAKNAHKLGLATSIVKLDS